MTNCEHILPNKISVFGKSSTMEKIEEGRSYYLIKCKECNYEEKISTHQGIIKIKSRVAEGKRAEDIKNNWSDLIQPTNADGSENRLFTKLYGYNPSSENPKTRKQPKPQDTSKALGTTEFVGEGNPSLPTSPAVNGGKP